MDCEACPALSACHASVRRGGPLLNGCDGRESGWQYEAGEGPGEWTPKPKTFARIELLRFARQHRRFTSLEAAELTGYNKSHIGRQLTELCRLGVLERSKLRLGGRGNFTHEYQVVGTQ